MDVIVLDDSEEEAQDSASTSFMEEVNRDLGNDPQHIIRAQVSSLPSLTLSCYISGYWGPALHSLGSSLPPAIDIVEDYLREARRHATHVPQEESLKVTIEDEDIHDLLVNSNDTTETLDDRG